MTLPFVQNAVVNLFYAEVNLDYSGVVPIIPSVTISVPCNLTRSTSKKFWKIAVVQNAVVYWQSKRGGSDYLLVAPGIQNANILSHQIQVVRRNLRKFFVLNVVKDILLNGLLVMANISTLAINIHHVNLLPMIGLFKRFALIVGIPFYWKKSFHKV